MVKGIKIKTNYLIKNGAVLGILIIIFGCSGIKPSTTKSGSELYETFFISEGVMQYFIKPLEFKNDTKEEMMLDITFRHKSDTPAHLKMSFITDDVLNTTDSLKIANDNHEVVLKNMNIMFKERGKKKYKSRFSADTTLSDVTKLFKNKNWFITIYAKDYSNSFSPINKTSKSITKLNHEIFSLF